MTRRMSAVVVVAAAVVIRLYDSHGTAEGAPQRNTNYYSYRSANSKSSPGGKKNAESSLLRQRQLCLNEKEEEGGPSWWLAGAVPVALFSLTVAHKV